MDIVNKHLGNQNIFQKQNKSLKNSEVSKKSSDINLSPTQSNSFFLERQSDMARQRAFTSEFENNQLIDSDQDVDSQFDDTVNNIVFVRRTKWRKFEDKVWWKSHDLFY